MPTLREQIDIIKSDLESKPELVTQLDKEMYVMEKYKELYESHPFLLKKLSKIVNDNDTENLEMLYLLLDKFQEVEDNKATKEEVETDLGQKLADKYMKK